MGMSSRVEFFQPPDREWDQKKAVYDACVCAGVGIPEEVSEFFNWETPEECLGKEIKVPEAVSDYSSDMKSGFEIDLSKLPKQVKFIRFINSF